MWMLGGWKNQRLHSKTTNNHPEMTEVRKGDGLLVVHFHDNSTNDSLRTQQSGDLGFSRFLADHPPSDGDNDDPREPVG
jgi:hypothetical protein